MAVLCWRHYRLAMKMGCGFLDDVSGMMHDLRDDDRDTARPCDWCALEALEAAAAVVP